MRRYGELATERLAEDKGKGNAGNDFRLLLILYYLLLLSKRHKFIQTFVKKKGYLGNKMKIIHRYQFNDILKYLKNSTFRIQSLIQLPKKKDNLRNDIYTGF